MGMETYRTKKIRVIQLYFRRILSYPQGYTQPLSTPVGKVGTNVTRVANVTPEGLRLHRPRLRLNSTREI
jgi:hypothetical protein